MRKNSLILFIVPIILIACGGGGGQSNASPSPSYCTNPCGPEQIITCAAQSLGITPENFYNTLLFNKQYQDGFCLNPNVNTGAQRFYYQNYCTQTSIQSGYFSYTNFIQASKSYPTFACESGSDLSTRYKEMSNFLSTVAQETTAGTGNYSNDGFYFRYENAALTGGDIESITKYYPDNTFVVATMGINPQLTYTNNYWYGSLSGALIYNLQSSPTNITWGPINIPTGYNQNQLNQIIAPGYWIGMGPIQLTGDAMMGFFGWYNNNLVPNNTIIESSFPTFVQNYLVNGTLAFQGAFWYWMERVSGINYITLHQMVNNVAKPVCHDIAAVTLKVNGGCNDYSPGRMNYYQYFSSTFNQQIIPVTITVQGVVLNSMTCTLPLLTYCQVL